jgi:co-chaperonin GroES (HSP10)
MPNAAMKHEKDPRDVILDQIGDLSQYKIGPRQILVATYRRPEKTLGGIIMPKSNLDEDLFQSKAGLAVKVGDGATFCSEPVNVGDWIVVRPSDCWALEVNFVHCRHIFDDQIRSIIPHPGMVW